jgi:N-acetylneuraminic acid mutarotase
LPDAGAPTPRYFHSAVWTGTEMLILGTFGVQDRRSLGGRYRPATNQWSALPTAELAPAPRSGHSAVWTGSEVVIWGGASPYERFGDGARFAVTTESWASMSRVGAPSPREGHTATWTGTEMIVWGGVDGSTYLNTGARYDPVADVWRAVSTVGAPSPRARHTAVWTGQHLLVWGGTDNATGGLANGGRYDPTTDTWSALSRVGAPSARLWHSAVWSGEEMLVWGGNRASTGVGFFGDGGRYRPSTDSWVPISATGAPTPRERHTAVWSGDEMIVWGGFNDAGFGDQANGGRYRPATDSWQSVSNANAPSRRSEHQAVWTGSEMVVWGGTTLIYASTLVGGRYSPATDAWQLIPSTGGPSARYAHAAAWTSRGLFVWGGLLRPFVPTDDGGLYLPSALVPIGAIATSIVTATPTARLTISPTGTATTGATVTQAAQSPTPTPTADRTPRPAATATGEGTLAGEVMLAGRTSSATAGWGVLTVTLSQAGTVVRSETVALGSQGEFAIRELPPGTYDLDAKHPQSVSVRKAGVQVSSDGVPPIRLGPLPLGDANGDNRVTAADFTELKAQFAQATACAGSDPPSVPCADFDANRTVGPNDFTLLKQHFGLTGPVILP